MKKILFGAALAALLATTAVSAQTTATLDPAGTPNYGGIALEAGFLPDPWIVSAIAGGDVDVAAAAIGTGCVGFTTSAPDFILEYSGVPLSNNLRILYVGNGDTSLIIADPAGNYVCNDTATTTDPQIDFAAPATGAYSIWVGSIGGTTPVYGYLMITEVESVSGAIFTDVPGFVTSLTQLTGAPVEATIEAEPEVTATPAA